MKGFLILLLLFPIFTITSAQTFVVTEYNAPANFSKERAEKGKKIIGNTVTLTFTDIDVRMSSTTENGDYRSIILEKKGNNIYRKYTSDNGDSYDELELDTFMGYITGCTFLHIHHGGFGGSMKMKRK